MGAMSFAKTFGSAFARGARPIICRMIWTPAITASTSAARALGVVAAHDGSQGLVLMLLDLFPRDLGRSPCGCRMEKNEEAIQRLLVGVRRLQQRRCQDFAGVGRGDIFLSEDARRRDRPGHDLAE